MAPISDAASLQISDRHARHPAPHPTPISANAPRQALNPAIRRQHRPFKPRLAKGLSDAEREARENDRRELEYQFQEASRLTSAGISIQFDVAAEYEEKGYGDITSIRKPTRTA